MDRGRKRRREARGKDRRKNKNCSSQSHTDIGLTLEYVGYKAFRKILGLFLPTFRIRKDETLLAVILLKLALILW